VTKEIAIPRNFQLIRDVEAGAHIVRSRYPFTVGGQKFVPEKYYTSAVADEVVNKARRIVSEVEKVIRR
jgi:HEPN domain-containing protein